MKNIGERLFFICLACSDLNLSYGQITTIYEKRWGIEEYHRTIKSNMGFAKSLTKVMVIETGHFILSIVAYIKSEWLRRCAEKIILQ
jgi:hypothetical protein